MDNDNNELLKMILLEIGRLLTSMETRLNEKIDGIQTELKAEIKTQGEKLIAQGEKITAQGEKLTAQGEKLTALSEELKEEIKAQGNKIEARIDKLEYKLDTRIDANTLDIMSLRSKIKTVN